MVVRVRKHPLGGALEDREPADASAIVGAIWKPLAPAPIMVTRLPAMSTV